MSRVSVRLLGGLGETWRVVRWPKQAPNVLKHSNDAWRKHPYVTTDWQSILPGIQYGFAAAVGYEGGVSALGAGHALEHDHGDGDALAADKHHDKNDRQKAKSKH